MQRRPPKPTIHTITAFVELTDDDFREDSEQAVSFEESLSTQTEFEKVTEKEVVLSFPLLAAKVKEVANKLRELKRAYEFEGYSVHSVGIATNPFGDWLLKNQDFVVGDRLLCLDALLQTCGISRCCLGPARTLSELNLVRAVLELSERFHCCFLLDASDSEAACEVTDTIYDLSSLVGGQANTRFGVASKTCKAWNPFFPVAYWEPLDKRTRKRNNNARKRSFGGCRKTDGLVVPFAIGLGNGNLTEHLLNECHSAHDMETIFRKGMVDALLPIQAIADNFCSKVKNSKGRKSLHAIAEIDRSFRDVFEDSLLPPGIDHNNDNDDNDNDNDNSSTRDEIKPRSSVVFKGIDTTVGNPCTTTSGATASGSFVRALEAIESIDEFGDRETFVVCAAIRSVLEKPHKDISTTGFCGISLPMGSDPRFAELIESSSPNAEMKTNWALPFLTIASVCGNGMDLVPIPGKGVQWHKHSTQSLRSLILDGMALAEETGKPLVHRFLPVSGKTARDTVDFETLQGWIRCRVVDVNREIPEMFTIDDEE